VFDPNCWAESPLVALGIEPSKDSLAVNAATCTSGTLQEQEACQAGVVSAQQTANANPAYACAMGNYSMLCNLGLTDANGNPTGNLLFWGIGILGGLMILREIGK
jgi:hypothetical protein